MKNINHRRACSNNVNILHGLQGGHRRTMSNIANNLGVVNLCKTLDKMETIPQDSLNSPDKSPIRKKKKGFISFLNASSSYFSHDSLDYQNLPEENLDSLLMQLEELKKVKSDVEAVNDSLKKECATCKKVLLEHQTNKKEFENSLNALKQYTQTLEQALTKVQNELRQKQAQNEELSDFILIKQKERSRVISPQFTNAHENSNKKMNKSRQEPEKPTPKPITYKPLSQRGLRSSREVQKNPIN